MHILSDTSLECSVDSDSRAIHEHKKTFYSQPLSQLKNQNIFTVGLHNSNIKLKNQML